MIKVAILAKAARPQFLIITPVCLFVGISIVIMDGGTFAFGILALAFIGALLTHVAVNVLNDYFDFKSGLDLQTVPTPFSGGSGTLVNKIMTPRSSMVYGSSALALATLIGLYLAIKTSFLIFIIGIPGILLVTMYTQYITRSPFLCLIAPGLGFGPLFIVGIYIVLVGSVSVSIVAASVIPGLLVSNLLLINQFPDVEADERFHRRVLPVIYGRKVSAYVFTFLLTLAYLTGLIAVVANVLPVTALLFFLTIPLGVLVVQGVLKNHDNIEGLIPYLGMNVILTISIPLLLSIGIMLA